MKKKVQNKNESSLMGKRLVHRALKYTGAILSGIIFIFVLILFFFPDPFVNSFLKNRIERALTESYPAYTIKLGNMHYSAWKNRLSCDSLSVKSNDSSFTFNALSVSVGGISWIKLFMQGSITNSAVSGIVVDAGKISYISNQNQDEVRFEKLHISVPDSGLTANSIKYNSLIDDEEIFSKSKFRQTRTRFEIPQIAVEGIDFQSMISKKFYKAKSISIHGVYSDILVNMDKPYDADSANPLMPNEALMEMKESFKIDSVRIINGRLKYSERYAVGAVAGVVNFDKVNLMAKGIANHSDTPDTVTIKADGIFMNSGMMSLKMSVPITQEKFSMSCSGSLGPMDVTKLNSFIVPAEHHRIKSGNIQSARFNINVNSGFASGSLRVEYRDLTIAILNEKTGSERGIFDKIASFFGKVFIIRGSNIPDEDGKMKIGEIKYSRKPADYFTQFLWFSLRGSIADVAGFPRE